MNRIVKEHKFTSIDENNIPDNGVALDQLSSLQILANTTSLNLAGAFQIPGKPAGLKRTGVLPYNTPIVKHTATIDLQHVVLNNALQYARDQVLKKDAEIAELKMQLQKANAELSKFVYVASHDLKEPVRMISNFMGLLKAKYAHNFDDKANTYLNFAIDGGMRLHHMIDDLLVLSRVGRCTDYDPAIDLNEIVAEVTRRCDKQAKAPGANFTITDTNFFLKGNKSEITDLFAHLVGNALKFCKPDVTPQIIISANQKNGFVFMSVEDFGLGITDDECEKAFDVFSRFQPRETFAGSGVGLAVCKKIVEQHGGNITIKGEEGKGCKVNVVLPAADQ